MIIIFVIWPHGSRSVWEPDSGWAGKENIRPLSIPNVHYCTHKSPPLTCIMTQKISNSPITAFLRLILILSSHLHLGLPSGRLLPRSQTRIFYSFLVFSLLLIIKSGFIDGHAVANHFAVNIYSPVYSTRVWNYVQLVPWTFICRLREILSFKSSFDDRGRLEEWTQAFCLRVWRCYHCQLLAGVTAGATFKLQ